MHKNKMPHATTFVLENLAIAIGQNMWKHASWSHTVIADRFNPGDGCLRSSRHRETSPVKSQVLKSTKPKDTTAMEDASKSNQKTP
jgi:hypothetical protein